MTFFVLRWVMTVLRATVALCSCGTVALWHRGNIYCRGIENIGTVTAGVWAAQKSTAAVSGQTFAHACSKFLLALWHCGTGEIFTAGVM